jgi:hypothetical protein
VNVWGRNGMRGSQSPLAAAAAYRIGTIRVSPSSSYLSLFLHGEAHQPIYNSAIGPNKTVSRTHFTRRHNNGLVRGDHMYI